MSVGGLADGLSFKGCEPLIDLFQIPSNFCEWLNNWSSQKKISFLNGGKYRRNFPDNCPKAEVPFSQISIQFYIAGLWSKNLFNGFLILQKPAMVGMLGIAPVRKYSLAHRWVFPKQTTILKSSNIFVNRILAPRTHGSWLAHCAWSLSRGSPRFNFEMRRSATQGTITVNWP